MPKSLPGPAGQHAANAAASAVSAALLEALPAGGGAALTAALQRLADPVAGQQSGLAEAGISFASEAPSAARFEDSVRLQRLFAAIDSEDRRQALLHIAEALAAGEQP